MTKNIKFFITFIFFHKAVVKQYHYMTHLLCTPFCDAAFAKSTLLQQHLFSRQYLDALHRHLTCIKVPWQGVAIGGQANYFKSANRKSLNSWVHSAIANPQISQVCQSENRKSEFFKGLIRKLKNQKFLQNNAAFFLKTVLIVVF